jgi:short-subunit dehydrogenase
LVSRRRFDLRGKRVLLTGAAGGIGTALALRLAKAGALLELADRDEDGLQRLVARLAAFPGPAARPHGVDLASPDALDGLCAALGDGPLDVLINNAGIAPGGAFCQQAPATLDAVLDINLRAAMGLTHRLLPRLLERPRAAIASIASMAGLLGPGGLAVYAASKFGLVGFSEALRAELRGRVGVSVICPPFVRTDIIARTAAVTCEGAEQVAGLTALVQRLGLPPDRVARACIEAIAHDRGRVLLGAAPRALLALRALSPSWADRANHAAFRLLARRLLSDPGTPT